MEILKHAHSGIRWILLFLLIAAIGKAYSQWKNNGSFTNKDRSLPLFTLILTHIQVLLGLGLYFMSGYVQFSASTMKETILRFYTVEHISMMLIAAVLITVGFSKAKKKENGADAWKSVFTFYLIALILIFLAIPWPFRNLGAGWF